jgi:hypothetical protein
MSVKKRIFNFVCIFIIAPIAAFFTIFLGRGNLFGFGIMWVWLILAHRYLVKMFDSTKEK